MVFAAGVSTFSYLNPIHLFHSRTNLTTITGLGDLSGVRQIRYAFSSCAVTTLDFQGFNLFTLTDLFCCFSWCLSLATICADSTWALPSSGISVSQCPYGCNSLIGDNGMRWSSSSTGYAYTRIDRTRRQDISLLRKERHEG